MADERERRNRNPGTVGFAGRGGTSGPRIDDPNFRRQGGREFRYRDEDDRRAAFRGGFADDRRGGGAGYGGRDQHMPGGGGGSGYANYGSRGGDPVAPGDLSSGYGRRGHGSNPDGTPHRWGYTGEENYDRGYRSADRDRDDDRGRGGEDTLFRGGGGRIPELQNEGGHRGRGPRGYARSDARIREDVCERLSDDPHLDASDIEVTVGEREVTLSGYVGSRFEKRHAEDLAEHVSGVTHVQNNLRVQPTGTGAAGAEGGRVGRVVFGNASAGSAMERTGGAGEGARGSDAEGVSTNSGVTGTSGSSGARTGAGTGKTNTRLTSGRTDDTASGQ